MRLLLKISSNKASKQPIGIYNTNQKAAINRRTFAQAAQNKNQPTVDSKTVVNGNIQQLATKYCQVIFLILVKITGLNLSF